MKIRSVFVLTLISLFCVSTVAVADLATEPNLSTKEVEIKLIQDLQQRVANLENQVTNRIDPVDETKLGKATCDDDAPASGTVSSGLSLFEAIGLLFAALFMFVFRQQQNCKLRRVRS